ncbi:MAG: hypothetical protein AAFU03_13045 [Bacteroidota bacterium]
MNTENLPQQFVDELLFTHNGFTAQLCCSPTSQSLAYALRYRAYRHIDSIPINSNELLYDEFDGQANVRTHLLWYEGEAVATVRSCIWSKKYDWAPTESVRAFWSDTHRQIGLQHNILESCRFALSPNFKGRKSLSAQLLLFRIQDLSSQIDQCRHIITAVRQKHVSFYQRMLGFQQISEPIRLPWVDAEIVLLTVSQAKSRQVVIEKGMPPCKEEEVKRYQNLSQQIQRHATA